MADVIARGLGARRSGAGWIARCPAHDDRNPSLSIGEEDGTTLVHCHAGCDQRSVISALRDRGLWEEPESFTLDIRPIIVRKYDYHDAWGVLLYQVLRYWPKDFRQRRPVDGGWQWGLGEVERVPYRLDVLKDAAEVVIVEGEKDVDALIEAGIPATWKGPARWSDIADSFTGKSVYIIPDNDKAGAAKAADAREALAPFAKSVTISPICADLGDKADVSDWLQKNDAATLLRAVRKHAPLRASGFMANDMRATEARQWLYGRHLIRGYVSATVSPGGVGKTTLSLTEAIALATGRPLLGHEISRRVKVWHYNLEDPRDELMRRCWAICEHFGIPPVELENWLFLDSGRDCKMIVAERNRAGVVVATPVAAQVREQMETHDISVLQVDPFVKSHYAEENDNKQIDAVLDVFGDIAKQCGAAVDLVHHTRKPPAGFVTVAGDINTARGAGALSGAVRSARTITGMSDKEAEAFDIERARRTWFVRVDEAKANMSAPAESATWFERHSIELASGDYVGVLDTWTPPDPFDGMGVDRARHILTTIGDGMDDGQRFVATARGATERWAGNVLIGSGVKEGAAKAILRTWLANEVIEMREYRNPVRRREERGLFVNWSNLPGVEQ